MGGIEKRNSGEHFPQGVKPNYYNDPERREVSDRNQAVFIESLEGLTHRPIGELPDVRAALNHRGGRSSAVHEILESEKAAALFHSGVEVAPKQEFAFAPRPLFRFGREDSRRQLFFGEMSGIGVASEEKPTVEVAVSTIPHAKDFIKHQQSLHEIAMYQHVASLDVPTLDVLGLIKSDAPDIYGFVITRYEPDIRTLDTLEWGDMTAKEAANALSHAVDTLALLHANYIFHGDPAFKNIAVCDANQKPTIVDLELSGSLLDEQDDVRKLSLFMKSDFSFLASSLDGNVGHLYQNEADVTSLTDRFNFMHEHVFLPYFNRLVKFGITPQDPLGLAYDNVVSRRLDEAVGDEGYWRHA